MEIIFSEMPKGSQVIKKNSGRAMKQEDYSAAILLQNLHFIFESKGKIGKK